MRKRWRSIITTILCIGMLAGTAATAYADEPGIPTDASVQEQDVYSIDENGNIFLLEEDNGGVVEEDAALRKGRSAQDKIVNFRANANGQAVLDTTPYTEYYTGEAGYIYGRSGADAAYLGEENGKVKFMIAGVVGLVDKSRVQVVNLSSAKTYSQYYAGGSSLIHRITTNMTDENWKSSANVGPQPSYLQTGQSYYSYDGHYFYQDYSTMLADYRNNTRAHSVNPSNPYYNYYQYLPLRSQTSYSGAALNSMINQYAGGSSKMSNTGTNFVSKQNTYGTNALIMASVGALESGWGQSSIAQNKNNLFGLNAVDASPAESADTYKSVDACIRTFAETYLSKRYLRAGWDYYHGGFLGDKASGMNVSYASDPYWGEKIAAVAWMLDNANGQKDYGQYTIGIKDTINTQYNVVNVRKEANTSSNVLYTTTSSSANSVSNYAVLIKGTNGSFYQIQSDPVLNSARTAIDMGSGTYDFDNMYAYISKDYVTVVSGTVSEGEGTGNAGETEEDPETPSAGEGISYTVHAQTYGWMGEKQDGAMAGTEGQSKRLEAVRIKLRSPSAEGSVEYRTHLQGIGWTGWEMDGAVSGTEGEARRMEAIRIRLTGEMAKKYDIYYRVHSQTYGWLDWAKNGETAGTTDGAKRMEALEIRLVKKGGGAPGETVRAYVQPLLTYQTHVQTYGWQKQAEGGVIAGTEGEAKRMEALKLSLTNQKYTGSIEYQVHVQTYGWTDTARNGSMAGTTGQAKRMEAVRIQLTGEMAKQYDVYYRVHSQTYGWLDWARNGQSAGTEGLSKRMEAIQIILVTKGGEAPGSTEQPFVKA
ncbi:glucosaminidase domain-containing protein [Mordavella massiliensis]|uniref:Glucosaminidase domain-containing protein n=1 Tax=Mordavella massiliensis TaxID=1871024 RepID=A0A938XF54_9CLOT|nr:glucosaminidase domain-containing protein [Mordavella massiliensis]MBM6948827.1 glucosaminidase domain-containing protein [Mordavella massiliensis]